MSVHLSRNTLPHGRPLEMTVLYDIFRGSDRTDSNDFQNVIVATVTRFTFIIRSLPKFIIITIFFFVSLSSIYNAVKSNEPCNFQRRRDSYGIRVCTKNKKNKKKHAKQNIRRKNVLKGSFFFSFFFSLSRVVRHYVNTEIIGLAGIQKPVVPSALPNFTSFPPPFRFSSYSTRRWC